MKFRFGPRHYEYVPGLLEWLLVAILLFWVFIPPSAYATDCDPAWRRAGMCPDQQNPPPTVTNNNDARAEGGTGYGGKSQSKSAAEAAASAQGYGGDASGQTVSSSYESAYIAVQRNLPRAIGCFGPVDGGGGEGNTFAFFGWTPLNKDCFAMEVSAGFEDAQVKSRVECGSKWFRNAISFEIRRGDRQRHCVDWMVGRYTQGVAFAKQKLELLDYEQRYETAVLKMRDKVIGCRTDSNDLTAQLVASAESTRRATEAWQKCLQK